MYDLNVEKRGLVMMTLMDHIVEIPERLSVRVDAYDSLEKKMNQGLTLEKITKIVVIGSGSSYNAGFATKLFSEGFAGLELDMMYPSIFLDYYNKDLLSKDAVYVFISQGGSTKLVLESLEMANKLGLETISVTENLDSMIAKEAKVALEMGSVKETFMFRTLGYSSTVTTLYLIEIALAKKNGRIKTPEVSDVLESLKKSIQAIDGVREFSNEFYKENKELLNSKPYYIFSGPGQLWPIAQEADIKFMEMLPTMTNSFELEELIHGPQNMFNDTQLFFLLSNSAEEFEKSKAIKNFITNEAKSKVLLVSSQSGADVVLPTANTRFFPLEFITFFQVLAYHLATARGRDLGKTTYPNITKYIKKTL